MFATCLDEVDPGVAGVASVIGAVVALCPSAVGTFILIRIPDLTTNPRSMNVERSGRRYEHTENYGLQFSSSNWLNIYCNMYL